MDYNPDLGKALSPQQYACLKAFAETGSEKDAAHKMDIAIQTFKNHITVAYRKLGVETHIEAFKALGWLNPDNQPHHVHIFRCYCGVEFEAN